MLLLNAAAPSQRSLGTVNSIGQMASALTRTLALFLSPPLFAASINKHLLGGMAYWIVGLLCAGCLCMTSWPVSDAPAAWRQEAQEATDEASSDR